MPTYRNPCATNPLLRKGGVHIRSKTGRRSRDRYDLLDEAAECMQAYIRQRQPDNEAEDHLEEVKGERDAPFSFAGDIIFTELLLRCGWQALAHQRFHCC